MVQTGRVVCIAAPFVLTLGSLICLVLVLLAGSVQRNATLDNLYYLKFDLTNITLNGAINTAAVSNSNITILAAALQYAKQNLNLKDYYTIYLRNYCAWNGNDQYAVCSTPQAGFYFDPVSIWGLNQTGFDVSQTLPTTLQAGLNTYKALAMAGWYLYIIGVAVTVLTLLVGVSAIFSRWGSFFTSVFAVLSSLLIVAATVVVSATYAALNGVITETLDRELGVKSDLGSSMWVLKGFLLIFTAVGGLFWLCSICCCSGRSPYNPTSKAAKRTTFEKAPYTYERVGSPRLGPQDASVPYLGPRADQAVPLTSLNRQGRSSFIPGQWSQRRSQHVFEPFRQA